MIKLFFNYRAAIKMFIFISCLLSINAVSYAAFIVDKIEVRETENLERGIPTHCGFYVLDNDTIILVEIENNWNWEVGEEVIKKQQPFPLFPKYINLDRENDTIQSHKEWYCVWLGGLDYDYTLNQTFFPSPPKNFWNFASIYGKRSPLGNEVYDYQLSIPPPDKFWIPNELNWLPGDKIISSFSVIERHAVKWHRGLLDYPTDHYFTVEPVFINLTTSQVFIGSVFMFMVTQPDTHDYM